MPSPLRRTSARLHPARAVFALLAAAALISVGACADDPALTCDPEGGPVTGDPDTHCGTKVIVLAPSTCAGDGDGDTTMGEPLYNATGEDDDCKYHVSWTATTICFDAEVYFTLIVAARFDNAPQVGAAPTIEGFLTDTPGHVLPDTNQRAVELGGGRYRIGPVRFDASGQWTVRFQLYQDCADAEASPRGHVAFFVDVP